MCKKNFYVRACSQNVFSQMRNFLQICKCNSQMCKCANVQMCKSANVQKTVVHKMRKSAAQIFFQMQKSQICTVHKFALCNFLSMQIFFVCKIFSVHFLFLNYYLKKFTYYIKKIIMNYKKKYY